MGIANYQTFHVTVMPDPSNPNSQKIHIKPGTDSLFSGGVVMDILVGIDMVTATQLKDRGLAIPEPIPVKALLDTGCTTTSIDRSVAEKLGLKAIGFVQSLTANGPMQCNQHLVSIQFPGIDIKGKPVHTIYTVDLIGQPIDALIGRDLMSKWKITYNGIAGFVSIAD